MERGPETIPRRPVGLTGLRLPVLGLGCAAFGNLYRAVDDEAAQRAIAAAWTSGVRFFDTAPYYGFGLSEQRLGESLRRLEAHDVVVSTKVGRSLEAVAAGAAPDHGFVNPLPNRPYFDYSRDGVAKQVESSMKRLGVTKLGMLLIHDIGPRTHGDAHPAMLRAALDDALPALNEFKAQGIVDAIGIGVNESAVCLDVLAHADVDVILLAGRYTLLEQAPAVDLFPVCSNRTVSIVIGGPFNSGVLVGDEHYDYGAVPVDVAVRVRRLQVLCRDHGVALPAAALQFPLAHPVVASVIPGARSADEVQSNVRHWSAAIPAAFWRDLRAAGLIDASAPAPDVTLRPS